MFTVKIFLTISLNVLLTSLLAEGNPFSGLGGEEVGNPYGSCQVYKLGGQNGLLLTNEQPLKDGSQLAFYPMGDTNVMLYLHIMLPSAIFKVKIEGTMVTLEKCESRRCSEVHQEGVKDADFIQPQEWNKVEIRLSSEEFKIYVGSVMVKSMSMTDYKNVENANWSVLLRDSKTKNYKTNRGDAEYIVQFMCEDFSQPPITTEKNHFTVDTREDTTESHPTHHTVEPETDGPYDTSKGPSHGTPAPHVETPSEKDNGNTVGLIVGVVVAVIILVALIIIIYNVIRKKRSATLNEAAPLQKTTK